MDPAEYRGDLNPDGRLPRTGRSGPFFGFWRQSPTIGTGAEEPGWLLLPHRQAAGPAARPPHPGGCASGGPGPPRAALFARPIPLSLARYHPVSGAKVPCRHLRLHARHLSFKLQSILCSVAIRVSASALARPRRLARTPITDRSGAKRVDPGRHRADDRRYAVNRVKTAGETRRRSILPSRGSAKFLAPPDTPHLVPSNALRHRGNLRLLCVLDVLGRVITVCATKTVLRPRARAARPWPRRRSSGRPTTFGSGAFLRPWEYRSDAEARCAGGGSPTIKLRRRRLVAYCCLPVHFLLSLCISSRSLQKRTEGRFLGV